MFYHHIDIQIEYFFPKFFLHQRSELRTCVCWDDSMYVYGVWDVKPTHKELRLAYEQTLWFRRSDEEIRDIKLKRILGNV